MVLLGPDVLDVTLRACDVAFLRLFNLLYLGLTLFVWEIPESYHTWGLRVGRQQVLSVQAPIESRKTLRMLFQWWKIFLLLLLTFNAKKNLVRGPQIKNKNLVLSHCRKPPLVKRVKLQVENLFALSLLSSDSFLTKSLSCITYLYLALCRVYELILTLR